MRNDERFRARARRAEALRALGGASAEYWRGYRLGMVRWLAAEQPATSEDAARDRATAAALAGEAESDSDLARWCGYYDGQRWQDPTAHRGLLRLAIVLSGESVRGFALNVLEIDDASVRQMLAESRPVPATRHEELQDLISIQRDQ